MTPCGKPQDPDAVTRHIPVLLCSLLGAMAPRDGATYIDGTFGEGGLSEALLDCASCRVFAIDRDPEAIARGAALARRYPGRLTLIEGRFGEMTALIGRLQAAPVAGVALDLGLSSAQLDAPERGFSFRLDGPLDMRMSREGQTAADLVQSLPEKELASVLSTYGEERFARRIARAIIEKRQRQPIRRTRELAAIVRAAVPAKEGGLDPATKSFQALRIAVNDELSELERGLAAAEELLMPGGRLAVISFHSLEDRRVKTFLARRSARSTGRSRHAPPPSEKRAPSFALLSRRAIRPDAAEIARNPRARSARLRIAERTQAPPWPTSIEQKQS